MKKRLLFVLVILYSLSGTSQTAQNAKDEIYKQFLRPPASARPRVWWHWMNGNITKEGIRKDLEWMHRAGIGGFQNFDAALLTPQIVKHRLVFMTAEWKDAFYFTARLADSLHLEMAIAGSPGWSESGGPWVKPEEGMKKLVWSEKMVQGGASDIILSNPPSTTGPFQNLPKSSGLSMEAAAKEPPALYKDIAVVAYQVPEPDRAMSELKPIVSSSGGSFSLQQLTDGDLATTNLLPSDSAKGYAWIQFEFASPQTIKAITVVGGGDKGPFGLFGELKDTRNILASDDGQNFKWISFIPAGTVLQKTLDIPPTTAKYFRVTFKNPPPVSTGFEALIGNNAQPPKAPPGTHIAEIVLHSVARINSFEEESAFAPATDLAEYPTVAGPADAINAENIIDLTSKMNADGSLNWTAPAGRWNIMRFGYSLMGITNHPASPEATGLEVDKLDAGAVKNYFVKYLDQYKEATRGCMGAKGGLQFMVTDSWEAGSQNWTKNLLHEFQNRRGYSMIPWMPVLTGHIVKSAAASEQFLWDFRKTLGDLVVANHYDQLTDLLQQYGMKRYSESHESGRALIADGMEVKRKAAVPMSAMWVPGPVGGDGTGYKADIRESASVAHIYGQNLVAAESLTTFGLLGNAWSFAPENLKPTADLELASGLNRFVIHTSVHQPTDDKIPGLGLGPFGQWFNRHDTWAEQARVWTDYLSRSSYLLQQGKFVADIVYYYGEDNNITSLFGKKLPDIPEGYNYDFINSDALIHLLSVKDGKLITPSGMTYQVLILDSNARKMSIGVLKKIKILVNAGASIGGIVPESPASLSDDPDEFKKIVSEIWNANNPRVFANMKLNELLNSLHIQPDFSYTKTESNAKLLYVHRKMSDRDMYWVDNRNNLVEEMENDFRIEGKIPEIWNPETGHVEPASYNISDGRTRIHLHLDPNEAVFVVFKGKASKSTVSLPQPVETTLSTIEGSWNLNFQSGLGAPASATFNDLSSWTSNPDPGIKYFSGTATYTKTFDAPAGWFGTGNQIWIDLGNVKNLAEVIVNGKSLGIVWKTPFRVEISKALKKGMNKLEIRVTNLWVNRLIGDQQPGVQKKITYTTFAFYKAGSPLLPSGLLGPVRIITVKNK